MNYAVCVKQVPAVSEGAIDPLTGNLIRSGMEMVCNPSDLVALEMAVEMRQGSGGTVTAFTMGPLSASTVLKEAVARGADRGFLISDPLFSGADVLATSYTMFQAIKYTGKYDCILTGNRTTDGDTGFIGAAIAKWFSCAFLSGVIAVEKIEEHKITVCCRRESSILRIQTDFPCVLAIEPGTVLPGIPIFSARLRAEKMEYSVIRLQDLTDKDKNHYGGKGSATKVKKIYSFKREKRDISQKLDGAEAACVIWEVLNGKL